MIFLFLQLMTFVMLFILVMGLLRVFKGYPKYAFYIVLGMEVLCLIFILVMLNGNFRSGYSLGLIGMFLVTLAATVIAIGRKR
ncbi:hypothetical protein LRR81_07950 [Metabacillus sp. GX 13764]|uniref:hypothetical protein n=1 Tax=Metabacillus kandeliae TaxID=2900151 RepID=UPI001E31312C|nr:hypothetical protein [Metabacillus kandeliae]MCD7034163.1 hypothetical protein [Metabacillus kandeliae]